MKKFFNTKNSVKELFMCRTLMLYRTSYAQTIITIMIVHTVTVGTFNKREPTIKIRMVAKRQPPHPLLLSMQIPPFQINGSMAFI